MYFLSNKTRLFFNRKMRGSSFNNPPAGVSPEQLPVLQHETAGVMGLPSLHHTGHLSIHYFSEWSKSHSLPLLSRSVPHDERGHKVRHRVWIHKVQFARGGDNLHAMGAHSVIKEEINLVLLRNDADKAGGMLRSGRCFISWALPPSLTTAPAAAPPPWENLCGTCAEAQRWRRRRSSKTLEWPRLLRRRSGMTEVRKKKNTNQCLQTLFICHYFRKDIFSIYILYIKSIFIFNRQANCTVQQKWR